MTKLSTRLPKDNEENGLDSNTRHLLAAYASQQYIPIVGLIRTKEVLQNEDFIKDPKVEFAHIEGAFDEVDADEVRALLTRLHDDRVRHIKTPLDLPDVDLASVVAEPLALTSGLVDVVDAEVVDDDAPSAHTGKDN